MKTRSLALLLFTAALLTSANAFAICQTCNHPGTRLAMCWTLDKCDTSDFADMSACVVKDIPGTQNRDCDPMGTTAGPECNGADPSCNAGGGAGGGGVGGPGGGGTPPPGVGGVTCILPISTQGFGCPADCNQCIFMRDLPPQGPPN